MTQDQTPSLRFPEFRGAEAWAVKKLGDIFSNRQEKGFLNLPLLSLTEKEGMIPQEKSNRTNTSNVDKSKYLRVCLNDIAYNTMRMWQGRSAFVDLEGIVSPAYTICEPKDQVDGLFFSYYFKTPLLIKIFRMYSQGLVNDTLSLKFLAFSKISILTPPFAEQQKIAECLLSLDEVIAVQGDRLDGLKDYKTGLMQQLFPAKGQTTPTLRFPEFQGKAPWQAKAGNEVFAQISNKEHDSNFPILAITQEHGAIPRDAIDYHVSVSEKSIANYKVVEIADFIISLRSFQGGIEYSNYKGLCSPAYVILRRKKDECEDYFKYFFKTERFIKDLNKNIEGLRDGKMVSYKQFSELFLPIPPLAEQQKIAECLSAMDDLISVQKQKIKDLNNHKNGLMQQLFPKL